MTKSLTPWALYIFMICQRIGFPPISIIGLGLLTDSSLIREPSPPARITAFICLGILPALGPFHEVSFYCAMRSCWHVYRSALISVPCARNHRYASATPCASGIRACHPRRDRRETFCSLRGVPSGLLRSHVMVP